MQILFHRIFQASGATNVSVIAKSHEKSPSTEYPVHFIRWKNFTGDIQSSSSCLIGPWSWWHWGGIQRIKVRIILLCSCLLQAVLLSDHKDWTEGLAKFLSCSSFVHVQQTMRQRSPRVNHGWTTQWSTDTCQRSAWTNLFNCFTFRVDGSTPA